MEIKINKENEVEYHFHPKLEDEFVDIASEILDIMREYYNRNSECLWILVDDFDLTFEEAGMVMNCPTDEFENLISDLFNHNHNENDFKTDSPQILINSSLSSI